MIGDILLAADEYFELSSTIARINGGDNAAFEKYIYFTDGMLSEIERMPLERVHDQAQRASLQNAKELLKRMRNREFYKYVGQVPMSTDQFETAHTIIEDFKSFLETRMPGGIFNAFRHNLMYTFY